MSFIFSFIFTQNAGHTHTHTQQETTNKNEKRSFLENAYEHNSDNWLKNNNNMPPVWQQPGADSWPPNDETKNSETKKFSADTAVKLRLCTDISFGTGEICFEIKKIIS